MSADYRILVSVIDGMHAGAAHLAPVGEPVSLGQADTCQVVLLDAGVGDQPVRVAVERGRLYLIVQGEGVWADGRLLAPGCVPVEGPQVQLRIGEAAVRVELLRRSQRPHAPADALLQRPRTTPAPRWAAWAWAGLLVSALLAVAGGTVSASARRSEPASLAEHSALRAVAAAMNARGASLAVEASTGANARLQGLVPDALLRAELETQLQAAGLQPELRVYDVQQMAESLTRLARLAGYTCTARHQGRAHFACEDALPDAAAAARMQAMAAQVPGVAALQVHVRERPALQAMAAAPARLQPTTTTATTATPATAPAAAPPATADRRLAPNLPVIHHVAILHREGIAFAAGGRRLRVGDSIGGARVVAIRLNAVDMLSNGERYTVPVTPAVAAAGWQTASLP